MLYPAVSCRLLLNTQRVNWQSQINLAALCVRLSIKILFLRKIKNISSSFSENPAFWHPKCHQGQVSNKICRSVLAFEGVTNTIWWVVICADITCAAVNYRVGTDCSEAHSVN